MDPGPAAPAIVSQSLPVLQQAVPFLIGKGGKSIQRITKLTDTVIHVSDAPVSGMGQEWRYATVRGTLRNVSKAKMLIILYLCRWCVMSRGSEHGIKGVQAPQDETAPEEETASPDTSTD